MYAASPAQLQLLLVHLDRFIAFYCKRKTKKTSQDPWSMVIHNTKPVKSLPLTGRKMPPGSSSSPSNQLDPWGSTGSSAAPLQVIFKQIHMEDGLFLTFFTDHLYLSAHLSFQLADHPTHQYNHANCDVNWLARRWFGLSVCGFFDTSCWADSTLELLFIVENYEM